MGQLCEKRSQPEVPIVQEKDYSMPSYSSKADKLFTKLESDYFFLKHFQLIEFLLMLTNYSKENSRGSIEIEGQDNRLSLLDKSYHQDFPKEIFQSFLESKILRHFLIYTLAGQDEAVANTFKDAMLEIYSVLLQKINAVNKPNVRHSLQKLHVIAIALLYCHAQNRTKMKFLFNLFVDEKNLFSKSPELNEFLFSIFLIPSYCMLQARKVSGERNDKIGVLSADDKFAILDSFEVKDSLRLREMFLKDFFMDKEGLTFAEFQANFEMKEFLWIFNPHGVRANLEKNNDGEPTN